MHTEDDQDKGTSSVRLLGNAAWKLRSALKSPDIVPGYLAKHLNATTRALVHGGVREAMFSLPELIDAGTYGPYIRQQGKDGLLKRPVQGFEMWLPVDDIGLSRELIRQGVHEPRSTELYGQLLRKLAERVDGVTVFEVGTNIGYFALLALDTLPADARMYAVEPNPLNCRLFERNLELNEYRGRVDVGEVALSDRNGTAEFYLSEATNWSQLGSPPEHYSGESIEVEVVTGDSFLREKGVDPVEVNVVRMDVQGHELDVLRGIPDVLGGEAPLLLYVEIHEVLHDRGQIGTLVDILERNGLFLERGFAEHPFLPTLTFEEFERVCEYTFNRTNQLRLFVRNEW